MNLLRHKSGRSLVAFAFYFSEGIPIGFIWWAMPTLLRKNGVEVSTITSFTAVLTLPWVFKFLWAPLIDIFRSARFGFTNYIGWSQLCMCITLIPLLFIPLDGNVMGWGVLLFLHSLCAATQDVSVDALVINIVPKHEKGMLNGYMQAGMLLGRSTFGGVALIFIPQIGLPATVVLMILAILCCTLLLFFIKEPVLATVEKEQLTIFKKNILETFRTTKTWHTIAFALTAAAAFEATGGLNGLFLTDKHVDIKSIGFFFSVPVVIAMLLGGLLGGFLSDKMGRKKLVAIFLLGFVLIVTLIAALGISRPDTSHITWMILFLDMYFFIGMFTSSSYALFMDVTNPKLGATEFSSFMAATNACEAWVVWLAASLVVSQGYSITFLMMCVVSLLSLLFLRKMNT